MLLNAEKERKEIEDIKKTKEQLESARVELEQAQRDGNFARASELRYARIPELQKKLRELREEMALQSGKVGRSAWLTVQFSESEAVETLSTSQSKLERFFSADESSWETLTLVG